MGVGLVLYFGPPLVRWMFVSNTSDSYGKILCYQFFLSFSIIRIWIFALQILWIGVSTIRSTLTFWNRKNSIPTWRILRLLRRIRLNTSISSEMVSSEWKWNRPRPCTWKTRKFYRWPSRSNLSPASLSTTGDRTKKPTSCSSSKAWLTRCSVCPRAAVPWWWLTRCTLIEPFLRYWFKKSKSPTPTMKMSWPRSDAVAFQSGRQPPLKTTSDYLFFIFFYIFYILCHLFKGYST